MKYLLFLIIFLYPVLVFGQAAATVSVEAERTATADSLLQSAKPMVQVGDTTQLVVQHRLDSMQGQLDFIQLRLDSLQAGGRVDKQLQDSLRQVLQKGHAFRQKLEQKRETLVAPLAKVPGMEMQMPDVNPVQSKLPELSVPGIDLPQATLPGGGEAVGKKLPDASLPGSMSENILSQDLQANLPVKDLSQQHFPKLDSSSISGKGLESQVEQQMLQQKEVGEFQKQTGLENNPLHAYAEMDAKDIALDQTQQAQEQLMAPLPSHKAALEKARRDLSKYNGRFTEIKSVKDLPKSPFKRHPLMGVKWYKRLQPGLQWQVGVGDVIKIDIGPRLSYLVTDKVELGASYQERLSIDKALPVNVSFQNDRVWGYHLFGSYEFKKGFYGQLSYERLNTLMQQLPNQQEDSRERLWIEGIRLGLGKRYTIYKQVRGYSLMEYNFTKSLHAPYRQQLQLKVGLLWDRRSSR
jgi:hypothetical protein